MRPPCRHMVASSEAYACETGIRITVHLCAWGATHAPMPPWLAEWAEAGGPTFRPEKHCPSCPVHEPYDFMSALMTQEPTHDQ